MESKCRTCGNPPPISDVTGCGVCVLLVVALIVAVCMSHGIGYDHGFEAAKVKYSRWF